MPDCAKSNPKAELTSSDTTIRMPKRIAVSITQAIDRGTGPAAGRRSATPSGV